jgi:hypothetical protein
MAEHRIGSVVYPTGTTTPAGRCPSAPDVPLASLAVPTRINLPPIQGSPVAAERPPQATAPRR